MKVLELEGRANTFLFQMPEGAPLRTNYWNLVQVLVSKRFRSNTLCFLCSL